MTLPLYKVKRLGEIDYDEYDSAIIAASGNNRALEVFKNLHHGRYEEESGLINAEPVGKLSVSEIAPKSTYKDECVVLGSFNAG
jgi:hypothetical protein